MRLFDLMAILRGLGLAVLVGLVACKNFPQKKQDALVKSGPLILNPPLMRSDQDPTKVRERWTTIQLPSGQIFAQAKDGMNDIVSFSAAEAPRNEYVKSLDDVERVIRSDAVVKFEKFRRTEALGIPVIRYVRRSEVSGTEDTAIASALNASSRTIAGPYFAKTLGAIFMHPNKSGSYVTLTCNRTSYHGEMGTYYEELFDDFVNAFAVENCAPSTPY